jgi:hypothetical protein
MSPIVFARVVSVPETDDPRIFNVERHHEDGSITRAWMRYRDFAAYTTRKPCTCWEKSENKYHICAPHNRRRYHHPTFTQ